jgi:hypothetical protein
MFFCQEMPLNGSFYGIISGGGMQIEESCVSSIYQLEYTDTLIRDTLYHKLKNGELHLYINYKYYIVDSLVENNKYILYDFTLEKNDIFRMNNFNKEFLVIERNQFLLANGEYRTHIILKGDITLEWIEGIGDIQNDFFYFYNFFSSYYKYIACVTDSKGNLIYKDKNFNYSCEDIEKYCI